MFFDLPSSTLTCSLRCSPSSSEIYYEEFPDLEYSNSGSAIEHPINLHPHGPHRPFVVIAILNILHQARSRSFLFGAPALLPSLSLSRYSPSHSSHPLTHPFPKSSWNPFASVSPFRPTPGPPSLPDRKKTSPRSRVVSSGRT